MSDSESVCTYPICYQKAILPEDLTCSIEDTLSDEEDVCK